jgi:hypothetical protein
MPGASLMMRFFGSPPRESRSASGPGTEADYNKAAEKIPVPFERLEKALAKQSSGPYFNGATRPKRTPPRVAPVASILAFVRIFCSRRSRTNALTPPSSR